MTQVQRLRSIRPPLTLAPVWIPMPVPVWIPTPVPVWIPTLTRATTPTRMHPMRTQTSILGRIIPEQTSSRPLPVVEAWKVEAIAQSLVWAHRPRGEPAPVVAIESVWDSPNSGTALFTDDQTLDADAGAFTAYITPDHSLFEDNTTLYLGLAIDSGAEMLPRLQLGSVPYAAVAGNAVTLQGQSASSFAPADHAPYTAGEGLDINGTSVSLNMSCAPEQVLKRSGTGWDCADAVDYTKTQQRVSGSCNVGQYITSINQDGTVQCANDENTQYTAASGLNLNGTAFSVATGGITNSHISATAEIDPTKIDGEAATLDGGATFTGPVEAPSVVSNDFKYRTGITGFAWHNLPASSFAPDGGPNRTWIINALGGYGYLHPESTNRFMTLSATVTLPKRANISALLCRVRNSHSTETLDFRARLRKRPLTSITATTLADIDETAAAGSTNIVTFSALVSGGETYDNTNNDYYISINFNPGTDNVSNWIRFYGCTLWVATSGPSFY